MGSDTDIIIASARAYVSALNKLLTWNVRRREKSRDGVSDINGSDQGGIGDAEPAAQPAVSVAK
jgi:2-isopropylmalate synthase